MMFLKPYIYSNRLKFGEDIHSVLPDFVNDLMDNYDLIKNGKIADFFLEADKIGKTIAFRSQGIEKYYKLVPNWVQIMLAQLAIFGASENGDNIDEVDRIKNGFRDLCSKFGWDAEDAINPRFDKTRTVTKFIYTHSDGKITFNMILESCLNYPIGSLLISPKGDYYKVNIPSDSGCNMLECMITGKLIPMTDYQLKNFRFDYGG